MTKTQRKTNSPYTSAELAVILKEKKKTPPTPTKDIAAKLNRPLRSVQLWIERLNSKGHNLPTDKKGRKPAYIPPPNTTINAQ